MAFIRYDEKYDLNITQSSSTVESRLLRTTQQMIISSSTKLIVKNCLNPKNLVLMSYSINFRKFEFSLNLVALKEKEKK